MPTVIVVFDTGTGRWTVNRTEETEFGLVLTDILSEHQTEQAAKSAARRQAEADERIELRTAGTTDVTLLRGRGPVDA